jgi:hypothetical protein
MTYLGEFRRLAYELPDKTNRASNFNKERKMAENVGFIAFLWTGRNETASTRA